MFCYMIVRVADSADSATVEVVMAIDAVVMSARHMFCKVSENEATDLDILGDSAVSGDSGAASIRPIFYSTNRVSTTPPTPLIPQC